MQNPDKGFWGVLGGSKGGVVSPFCQFIKETIQRSVIVPLVCTGLKRIVLSLYSVLGVVFAVYTNELMTAIYINLLDIDTFLLDIYINLPAIDTFLPAIYIFLLDIYIFAATFAKYLSLNCLCFCLSLVDTRGHKSLLTA